MVDLVDVPAAFVVCASDCKAPWDSDFVDLISFNFKSSDCLTAGIAVVICGDGLVARLARRDFVVGAVVVTFPQLAEDGNADESTLLPFRLSAVSLLGCRTIDCELEG